MKKVILITFVMLLSALQMSVNAQYKIGDIYNENGIKGVVISVDASGQHGLILHPDGFKGKWCDNSVKMETNANDENNGEINMKTIEAYLKETGKSWDLFPLFQWARDLGEGWYIPANAELKELAKAVNGGTFEYDEKSINQFSKIMKKAGAKKGFINKMPGMPNEWMEIYSSTEADGGVTFSLVFKETKSSSMQTEILGKLTKRHGKLDLETTLKNPMNLGITLSYGRAVHKF
ncbi:MAG: hypothetical protein II852_15055 [Bacteroidales bacterium]|jgi:hypothetical protein|nr:hypothetical protein [Bacteroidales bacterium]